MARKSTRIKTLTSRDKKVVNMGQKCGYFTVSQAERLCGIKKERLDKMVKSNILDKCSSKYGDVYKISDKCLLPSQNGLYHRASIEHDLRLSEKWLFLTPEQREGAKTADSFIREHNIDLTVGTPDLVIETETELLFIEITTDNYTQVQIEEKQTFAVHCNATLELTHTSELDVK